MEIRRTRYFDNWLYSLRDRDAQSRITRRLKQFAEGNHGKIRGVGGGIIELKSDFGPGYRIYYVQKGDLFVLLLCGGDKNMQTKDIERARIITTEFQ